MDATAAVREEIDELLAAYDACWNRLELGTVADFWDRRYPNPVYIGEEYAAPIVGWAELNKHWARVTARLQSAQVRSSVVVVDLPSPELASVVLLSQWRFCSVESTTEHRGESWVSALLRCTPDGWRFFHYAEAPIFRGGDPAEGSNVA